MESAIRVRNDSKEQRNELTIVLGRGWSGLFCVGVGLFSLFSDLPRLRTDTSVSRGTS